jgi:chorismate synthase
MSQLRFLTAGESHGQALLGILEGAPAGVPLSEDDIARELRRRQMGYGRGQRMKIESDCARILSGVRGGKTLGSPIALEIENKDWKNWQTKMSVAEITDAIKEVTVPRPGHADFAGAIKYGHRDLRNVLERASARETAMRVALGAIAKKILAEVNILIVSHVVQIHSIKSNISAAEIQQDQEIKWELVNEIADGSLVRCLDKKLEAEMMARIDEAKTAGDTVGGVFEVVALNVPIGLGSYGHWDRKLDGRIAGALMSIPAIKGVEIGWGFEASARFGSEVHDPIYFDDAKKIYFRSSNHAGGIEGGVSNGMPIVVRAAMKPISTLMKPLDSVDMISKEKTPAHIERSDVCAAPAAAVIGEAVLALVLAEAFLEKFGGDSIVEIREAYERWQQKSQWAR